MLALVQEVVQQLPAWLRWLQALAISVGSLGTAGAIIFAVYKFYRQGEHDPRLQPTVTGTAAVHEGIIYVFATVTAENTGQVDVTLNLEASTLNVLTTKAGDEGWTPSYPADVFLNHSVIQPGETIEDQLWFEVPYDGEIGIKLNLDLARIEDRVYPTTEIISLLSEEGGNNS